MTIDEQIGLLKGIADDVTAHVLLKGEFNTTVSASPISGEREETIKAEYLAHLDALRALYLEVIHAIAAWLVEQP